MPSDREILRPWHDAFARFLVITLVLWLTTVALLVIYVLSIFIMFEFFKQNIRRQQPIEPAPSPPEFRGPPQPGYIPLEDRSRRARYHYERTKYPDKVRQPWGPIEEGIQILDKLWSDEELFKQGEEPENKGPEDKKDEEKEPDGQEATEERNEDKGSEDKEPEGKGPAEEAPRQELRQDLPAQAPKDAPQQTPRRRPPGNPFPVFEKWHFRCWDEWYKFKLPAEPVPQGYQRGSCRF